MKTPEELVHDYKTMDTTSKEPALKEGGIVSAIYVVGSIIAVFLPSIESLNPTFRNVLMVVSIVATIVIPFFLSVVIRNKVWSPASVAVLINQLESMKAQENHPLDNLAKDFFSGETKHSHASYITCTETCPRHPDYIEPLSKDEL